MKTLSALSILFLVTACSTGNDSMNETIFVGGTVAVGPTQTPQKNQAIDVGPTADVRARHNNARIVDVSSATILPGLTDAHAHLYSLGLALDTVSLVGTTSTDEALSRVVNRAASTPAGEWIVGRGWDQNHWAVKEFPDAAMIDRVIADRPVWLRRIDGHAGWANTAAMRAAEITKDTKDPQGGRIIRDAAGNPTGVFVDEAQELIDSKVPPPSFELRKKRVLAAAQNIAQNGLVEIHDAGADADTIRAVRELITAVRWAQPLRRFEAATTSS